MLRVRILVIILIIGTILVPILPRAQAPSSSFPYVRAWDGILPTEPTADLQATFTLLQQRGYNAARISLVDPVLGVNTFDQAAFNNLLALAKQHGIWLIMDDHEYGITDEAAWLSFWAPIITAYQNEPMIIWQPRNEPSNSASQLSTFYQDWINQDRNLGDNHWIIVAISYSQFGAPNDSTFLSAFPTVTDPLQQVAYDFHDYYFYQYHPAWSISDAQAYAANVPAAVLSLEAFKNAPAVVSEFGADSSGGGPLPPDDVNPNCSCQYTPESLAYVTAVIQGLDTIQGSYGLWEAGDWDGSGMATGAMNVWGQTIPTPASTPPPQLSTSFTFLPTSPVVNTTVTFAATTTGGTTPYSTTWNFGDGTLATGNSVTHTFASAQSFTVQETTTDSSAPTQTASSSQSVTVLTTLPLSIALRVSTSTPSVGQTVTFTASATGGTAPYTYAMVFGDGAIGTGSTLTHAYSTAGSYTAILTVTDSSPTSGRISTSKIVNVQSMVPPTLSVPGNQTVNVGAWINFTVTAASLNTGGTISLSAAGLPAGASFDPTTRFFSWKPSSDQIGSYTIVFTATDSSYPSTPTAKQMGIQVDQASPGGSNGGSGGTGGSSSGSCALCEILPRFSSNTSLLLVGGLVGLISSIAFLSIRARMSLERTKRRLEA